MIFSFSLKPKSYNRLYSGMVIQGIFPPRTKYALSEVVVIILE